MTKKSYSILYARQTDQERLKKRLLDRLEGTGSEIFIPEMEYYRRGEKAVKVKPVFPGYVFIYSDLEVIPLHRRIRNAAFEAYTGARELGFREKYTETLTADPESELIALPDLSEEEAHFLDFFREGNGLLSMSKGYEESRKYIVMEGPLKAFEDKIKAVDKHNRKAFLTFEFNGRRAQAGFECRPKACWFPNENSKITKLSDGTEVDLEELKEKMR